MRIEEGRGEILTGYVLGEELGTLSESFWCFRVPKGFDEDVMILTRYDNNVASCSMAYFGAIA